MPFHTSALNCRQGLALLVVSILFLTGNAHAVLIGHWTFDEGSGTTTADLSPFSRPASLSGAQNWITGVAGGAFRFPGSGGTNFSVNLTPELPLGSAERTITAWINPATQGDRKFLAYSTGAGSTFNFTVEGNGVRLRHGAGNVTFGISGSPIPLNAWTHVGIRVPAGAAVSADLEVFINGIEATITGSGGGSGLTAPINSNSTLFRMGSNTAGNPAFNGALDDIQFYNNALSDGDIALLFANPGVSLASLAVPEPSAFVLMGLALIALGIVRQRTNRQTN